MHASRGEAHISDLQKERGVPFISLMNNKINELRARLEKLAARNIEATQSTSTSSFSADI